MSCWKKLLKVSKYRMVVLRMERNSQGNACVEDILLVKLQNYAFTKNIKDIKILFYFFFFLTHLMSLVSFYTSKKHQKTRWGIEGEQGKYFAHEGVTLVVLQQHSCRSNLTNLKQWLHIILIQEMMRNNKFIN